MVSIVRKVDTKNVLKLHDNRGLKIVVSVS